MANEWQVETVYTEVLTTAAPAARVETLYEETLVTGSPAAQVETIYASALVTWTYPGPSNYSTLVLADGPAAYWKQDETSGTTMADSSGNSHNGTYSGATLNTRQIRLGAPRSTTGTATGQGVGNIASAAWMGSPTSFTVEFWVKYNNAADVAGLVSRFATTGWVVWQRAGRIGYTIIDSSGQKDHYGPLLDSTGAAHHVALVVSGARSWLYYDGVDVETGKVAGNWGAGLTAAIQIGGYNGTNYSSATFSDVAYYTYALTDDQVWAHYTGDTAPLAALDPTTVSSLALRYNARALTGLNNNDPVAAWPTTVGGSHDLTQATAGFRPQYKTGALNGYPVVRFDGTDDGLLANNAIPSDASITVISLQKLNALAATYVPWSLQVGNSGIATAVGSPTPYKRALFDVGVQVDYSGGTATTNWETWAVVARTDDAVYGTVLYVDGSIVMTSTKFNPGRDLSLGYSSSQNLWTPEDIADFLVFTEPLSSRQVRAIKLYLDAYWAAVVTGFDGWGMPI